MPSKGRIDMRIGEWYWYIARNDEIFVDLDHRAGNGNSRVTTARARLEGAIRAGKLAVNGAWLYASSTPCHYHLMVNTRECMSAAMRLFWEQRLCDDSFRSQMNLARLAILGQPWSILIAPEYRKDYHRAPDYACRCPDKHKGDDMAMCPISRRLSGACLDANHWGAPVYRDDPLLIGRQL